MQIIPDKTLPVTDAQRTALAQSLQMPYLSIGAAFLLVAVVIMLIKLPTITHQTDERGTIAKAWKYNHLRFGVLAIFIYEGIEIAIPSFMVQYATGSGLGVDESTAATFITFYFLAMLIGRFTGIFVMKRVTDKVALSVYASAGIVLVALGLTLSGPVAIGALILSGLCQSVMWGNIFGLATRGLDYLTNKATSLMLTAIAGGGIITVAMGAVADHLGVKAALFVMIPLYIYMIWFALSAGKMAKKYGM